MRSLYLIGIISLFLSFNTSHAAEKATEDKDEKQGEEGTTQSDENAGSDLDSNDSPPWYEKIPVIRIRGEEGNRVAFDGLRLRTGLGISEHAFKQSSENASLVFPPQADFVIMNFPVGFNLESLVYKDMLGLRMNSQTAGYSTKIGNDSYTVRNEMFNAAVVYRHTFQMGSQSQPTENVEQVLAPDTTEKTADKKSSKAKKSSKNKKSAKDEKSAEPNQIPEEKPSSDSKTKIALEGILGYNQTSNIVIEYSDKARTGAKTTDLTLSGVEMGLGAVYRIYDINLRAYLSETFAPSPILTRAHAMVEYEVMQLPVVESVLLIHVDAGVDWSHFTLNRDPDSASVSTMNKNFSIGAGILW